MGIGELTDKELVLVAAFCKHIRRRIDEWYCDKDGWDKLREEMEEFIDVSDEGLSSSLISKIYRSSPY